WPVLHDDDVAPPTFHQWLETLQKSLGTSLDEVKQKNKRRDPRADQRAFSSARDRHELDMVGLMCGAGGAADSDRLVKDTKWLKRCVEIANEQRFFHWELDFAAAFDRGGFDLQVGNPPWVRPTLDVASLLGECDPWWVLATKPSN